MPAYRTIQSPYVVSSYMERNASSYTFNFDFSFDFVLQYAAMEPSNCSSDSGLFAESCTTSLPASSSSSTTPLITSTHMSHNAESHLRRYEGHLTPGPGPSSTDRIARPRNAFIIFRSEFCQTRKVDSLVERENKHISRIAGHVWRNMSDEDKQVYKDMAAAEKKKHADEHPDYVYKPVRRANKAVRRQVARNSEMHVARDKKLAELVSAGYKGVDLVSEARNLDLIFGIVNAERTTSVDTSSVVTPPFLGDEPLAQCWP